MTLYKTSTVQRKQIFFMAQNTYRYSARNSGFMPLLMYRNFLSSYLQGAISKLKRTGNKKVSNNKKKVPSGTGNYPTLFAFGCFFFSAIALHSSLDLKALITNHGQT